MPKKNDPNTRDRPFWTFRFGLIFLGALSTLGSLFFYSFTQVDLNLTLSTVNLLYAFQDFFQHIGYFDRPFSTYWYSATVIALTITYTIIVLHARKNNLRLRHVWLFVFGTVALLALSYPAFSYDIYNYMFDARIVTKYGHNPYVHKALDYPGDPWINFMRWTHRVYPYGPLWLAVSVPLSYAGIGKLLPTLLLFKSVAIASYLVSARMIVSIAKKTKQKIVPCALAAFALNPLVIIESLVSAHNDALMMALALVSFYFLMRKKWVLSAFILFLSIGIKFATAFLVPVYILVYILHKKKISISWEKTIILSLLLMIGAVLAATVRTQFQPWYLLYVLPFAALASHKNYIFAPMIVLTLAGLAQYVPFLYRGDWDPPVPAILTTTMLVSVVVSLLVFVWYYKKDTSSVKIYEKE